MALGGGSGEGKAYKSDQARQPNRLDN